MDAVFNHLVDSRVNIYDGDTMKFLGLVPSSFNGHMTVSADGKDIYIMTTYYERLNRGKRTDVVEAWDAETLTPKYEVPIPEKRAQALNYRNYLQQSSDVYKRQGSARRSAPPARSGSCPCRPCSG